jgi:hypothetical protein
MRGTYNSVLPTLYDGKSTDLQLSSSAELYVQLSRGGVQPTMPIQGADGESNGSAVAGLRVYARPAVFNGSTWDRLKKPNAVGRLPASAASTNATSVKASAGDLWGVQGYNAKASVVYLKLYNKASAPTVGTDTPFLTIALAPSSVFSHRLDGLYFSAGIAYALTTAAADSDTTAVLANDVLGLNITYA